MFPHRIFHGCTPFRALAETGEKNMGLFFHAFRNPYCQPYERGGGQGHWHRTSAGHGMDHDDGDGGFGVRRPLRFMVHQLELDERQTGMLAAILTDLKTERAQAAVDLRRSVAGIAEAMAATFDEAGAAAAVQLRVTSAERLRDAVLGALRKTHAMLTEPQRQKLAFLLRSGQLTI
jgi:Spy/CpxP family protein refolding chaperone